MKEAWQPVLTGQCIPVQECGRRRGGGGEGGQGANGCRGPKGVCDTADFESAAVVTKWLQADDSTIAKQDAESCTRHPTLPYPTMHNPPYNPRPYVTPAQIQISCS